jgi:hypothetical protein
VCDKRGGSAAMSRMLQSQMNRVDKRLR